ncbi:MAG: SRPBCC family protein [Nevskiales bacterium]
MANEVHITRRLDASPDEVYDAWLDPESVAEWMIPSAGGRTEAKLDPRVGGRFQIDMFGETETYPHHGEYLRLERPRLIEFSWVSNATAQQRSIVTIELSPLGETQTELKLHHRLLASSEAAREHHSGWSTVLDRLADRFAHSTRPK